MDINNLTVKEAIEKREEIETTLNELNNLFEKDNYSAETEKVSHGYCVVILDKGFIYVGELFTDNKYFYIKDSGNLRYWSSGKGLLWHVKNGKEDADFDYHGVNIQGALNKLQNWMITEKSKWKS